MPCLNSLLQNGKILRSYCWLPKHIEHKKSTSHSISLSISLSGDTLNQKGTALHDMTARSSESWRILRSHLSNVAGTGTCSAMRAAKKWWAKCGGGVPSCPSLFKGGFGFWQNPGSHMVPTFIHHLLDVSDVFRCIHMMNDLMITLYSDNLADTAMKPPTSYSDDSIPKI